RTGVYFVLALGLFPRIGYARVWAKLCAGLAGAGLVVPAVSEKALRELRRRLGPAPFRRCSKWLPDRWRSLGRRGVLCRDAHGRFRWPQFAQDPRHRTQPLLDR